MQKWARWCTAQAPATCCRLQKWSCRDKSPTALKIQQWNSAEWKRKSRSGRRRRTTRWSKTLTSTSLGLHPLWLKASCWYSRRALAIRAWHFSHSHPIIFHSFTSHHIISHHIISYCITLHHCTVIHLSIWTTCRVWPALGKIAPCSAKGSVCSCLCCVSRHIARTCRVPLHAACEDYPRRESHLADEAIHLSTAHSSCLCSGTVALLYDWH